MPCLEFFVDYSLSALFVCVKNVHLMNLRGGIWSLEPANWLTVAWEVVSE